MVVDERKLFEEIGKILLQAPSAVIAIDGRCASGKTTISQKIADAFCCSIIHTDDFFLPMNMRTEERLCTPGGNIHYERLHDEVIAKLRRRKVITYGVFDCSRGAVTAEKTINPAGPIIVEGAYAMHPYFGEYYDTAVFVTAEIEIRLSRIEKRNGKEKLSVFQTKWIPLEEEYIACFGVDSKADFTIVT